MHASAATKFIGYEICSRGVGGTLGISGWGFDARTLELLAYTRASFSYILLPYTRVTSRNHSYPRQIIISSSVL